MCVLPIPGQDELCCDHRWPPGRGSPRAGAGGVAAWTAAVGSPAVRTGLAPIPRRRRRPWPVPIVERLVDQIEAGPGDVPSEGGWSGGFANQAHWDPSRARDWRCWAQSGPTWSAHCGAEVAADDTLGLCQRHRRSLLEGDAEADLSAPPAERGPLRHLNECLAQAEM